MSRAKVRLRAAGIAANEVSASRMMLVPHTDLVIAAKGDALFDPRSLDPVDETMAANMVERVNAAEVPNRLALLVWERPGHAGLLVGDGHQRTNALGRASELLDGRTLMVLVEFFDGDEKGFLLERARRNDHDRFAKRDKVSTLAFRVKQLAAIGASEAEIDAALPSHLDGRTKAALPRWPSLSAELRPRFDSGEIPIGLLAAILEHDRAEQPAAADKLIAAGVRTSRQAARQATKARTARDPWARPWSPKRLTAAATALDAIEGGTKAAREALWYVAAGMLIAAGDPTAPDLLRRMPEPIANAIRQAHAAKAVRS